MRDLKITLFQGPLAWEDPAANRDHFSALLADIDADTDLVLLPEMFSTGFSMDAEANAEAPDGETTRWMCAEAARHDIALTGSLPIRSEAGVCNRLQFVTPDGRVQHYDKRHLFRMSGEHEHYAGGDERVVLEWRDWRICPMVCYDLRFPVWSRNRDDYDLLLYVANWPAKRAYHWRSLLLARAIENQAYCIGVNRIGSDGNGLDYSGDSLVLAADGEVMVDAGNKNGSFSAVLEAAVMERYRRKFPCHQDADNFRLE